MGDSSTFTVGRSSVATRDTARARPFTLSARAWLGLIVGTSFVLRTLAALPRSTPRFFPDEYIYSALGRSIASGHIAIRGGPAHFPALLEPILTAPIWLLGNVELSYRILQGFHAGAMSLAAIPSYALARQLGIGTRRSLLAATAAVSVPALIYSSYATADAIGYPLVVWSVLLAVRALERPSAGRQAAFLCVAGATSFARIQYVVLVPSFVVAAAVVADFRPRVIARSAGLVVAIVTTAVALAGATAGSAALGVYGGVLSSRLDPQALGDWAATNAMLLAYASGAVLVPTAVAGLVYGVRRSAPPAERAFAAFTISLTVLLLFASALIVTNETGRFYERYLIGLFPLIPIAFCVGFRRLPQGGRVAAGATVGVLLCAMAVPLSGFTVAFGPQDSPFLQAVSALEQHLGYANGSITVAFVVSALVLLGLVASWRQRWADGLLLLTVAVTVVASVGAVSWDRDRSLYARSSVAASDLRWIDHAHAGPATVLVLPGDPSSSMFDLFWNTSLERVALLPGARPIDSFATSQMMVGKFGDLTVASRALQTAFVVRENWAAIQLSGARRVASGGEATLWVPTGRPRRSALDSWPIFRWMALGRRRALGLPDPLERPGDASVRRRTSARIPPDDTSDHRPRDADPIGSGPARRDIDRPGAAGGPDDRQGADQDPGRAELPLADGRAVAVQASVPHLIAE